VQLSKLVSADGLTGTQLKRLQTRLQLAQGQLNSAEFMRLTKAKDQITQITEAILLDVLSVTLSLKASAKVMKAVWKSKLKPLVAPRVGNRPSRGKMEPPTSKPPSRTLLPSPNRIL
jgi:hypothetical protein